MYHYHSCSKGSLRIGNLRSQFVCILCPVPISVNVIVNQTADNLYRRQVKRTVWPHCTRTHPATRLRILARNVDAKEEIDPRYAFKSSQCDPALTKTNRGMHLVGHSDMQGLKFIESRSNSFSEAVLVEGRKWLHTLHGSNVTDLLIIS